MTFNRNDLHVYEREITEGERSSLSVLAGLIPQTARVLDLGTGSGALGRYLAARGTADVDGLTYNEEEAALARPHYRRVEVADLERTEWVDLFRGQPYDRIVCADVLEHLREPETALRACRALLAPGGQVLISVPNAAYCGLVAELLDGDFRYRDEGLLDRTHLRFFTRRSLQQFLRAEGWAVHSIDAITVPLTESEFRGAFHKLPPAVSRYLLALPDGAGYQLVAAAQVSAEMPGAAVESHLPAPPQPLFSMQLYLADENGFSEERKVVQPGVMGQERQTVRFALPQGASLRGLRLDPADRPGFLRLHRISLRADGKVTWQWQCDSDGLPALEAAPHHDLMLRAPWPAASAMALVHGDDPYIDLPVPPQALAACSAAAETALEVELDWPMSADYLALVELVQPLHQQMETQRVAGLEELEKLRAEASENLAQARREQAEAREQADEARAKAAEAQRLIAAEQARAEALAHNLSTLQQQHKAIAEEKNLLARQRIALQADLALLGQQYQALGDHLRWIEQSTVFRATRPLVQAKMTVERLLGRRPPAGEEPGAAPLPRPMAPPLHPVDVIVPVYRGLADTQRCITSVLASECRTPWRLVVLNDASPEPEVTQWLRAASREDDRILLLENEQNLGFVGTVNRGMSESGQNDVLLLNSDTEVANDWLDRLRAAAYGDARVASVTPFSNNATICSYPLFCEPNELPPNCDTASLDAVFASTNAGLVVDVPTGIGFCMYIRRDALAEVGLFDVEQFGKGYGEENDFCRRAADAGWRNLHALDTFVLHTGGVSFGDSKSQREREAVEKLRRLHPSYDGLVHAYVQADPAREGRHAVDIARIRGSGLPCVLAVMHDRAGGTQRHVQELARHFSGRAFFLLLTPAPGGTLRLELLEPGAGFRLEFSVAQHWDALVQTLRSLGVAHVHYHSVMGHGEQVVRLAEQLGLAWDVTGHDYFAMCPQITLTGRDDRFCGEQGGGECRASCSERGQGLLDIAQWRADHGRLLAQARHVLVPSRDTARRFARMWPNADIRVAPHTDIGDPAVLPEPQVRPLQPNAPLRIAVLGGLSKIKGADLLEDVAVLVRKAGLPIEFHLIGHAYRSLQKQPRAALTVHGPYLEPELNGLLGWLKPDLVWFPALWPETYSYTLSACLQAGLPVVAPDLGAFAERLDGRKWSWLRPWDAAADTWPTFFERLRTEHFATGRAPQPSWQIAPATEDARLGSWSYDTEYLQGVVVPPLPAHRPAPGFLAAHRPGAAGPHQQGRQIRQLALTTIVKLRSTPLLRRVARAIPLRWQTRVKSWLQA